MPPVNHLSELGLVAGSRSLPALGWDTGHGLWADLAAPAKIVLSAGGVDIFDANQNRFLIGRPTQIANTLEVSSLSTLTGGLVVQAPAAVPAFVAVFAHDPSGNPADIPARLSSRSLAQLAADIGTPPHTHPYTEITGVPSQVLLGRHDPVTGVTQPVFLGSGLQWVGNQIQATAISGVTAHSSLTGLGADDHPHYLTYARADIRYSLLGHQHIPSEIVSVPGRSLLGRSDISAGAAGSITLGTGLAWSGSSIICTVSGGGVTDHGSLSGLGDDDHPQYLTPARGDLRYAPLLHYHTVSSGQLILDSTLLPSGTGHNIGSQASPWGQAWLGGPLHVSLVNTALAADNQLLVHSALGEIRRINKPSETGAFRLRSLDGVVGWTSDVLSGTASGDLSGNYPGPSVVGLRGRSISSTAPNNGQVLAWNSSSSSWVPWTPTTTVSGTEPLLVGWVSINPGGFVTGWSASIVSAVNAATPPTGSFQVVHNLGETGTSIQLTLQGSRTSPARTVLIDETITTTGFQFQIAPYGDINRVHILIF